MRLNKEQYESWQSSQRSQVDSNMTWKNIYKNPKTGSTETSTSHAEHNRNKVKTNQKVLILCYQRRKNAELSKPEL